MRKLLPIGCGTKLVDPPYTWKPPRLPAERLIAYHECRDADLLRLAAMAGILADCLPLGRGQGMAPLVRDHLPARCLTVTSRNDGMDSRWLTEFLDPTGIVGERQRQQVAAIRKRSYRDHRRRANRAIRLAWCFPAVGGQLLDRRQRGAPDGKRRLILLDGQRAPERDLDGDCTVVSQISARAALRRTGSGRVAAALLDLLLLVEKDEAHQITVFELLAGLEHGASAARNGDRDGEEEQ